MCQHNIGLANENIMIQKKNLVAAMLASSVLFLGGCVTINVYFPAAAAERAADKLIDEIWKIKKGQEIQQQRDATKNTANSSPTNEQDGKK